MVGPVAQSARGAAQMSMATVSSSAWEESRRLAECKHLSPSLSLLRSAIGSANCL